MADTDDNLKRGSAELAVLAMLEKHSLHGYEIAKRIEVESGGALRFDVASLYPLLYRLEKDGFVAAHWEQGPNGRRRRYYRLTPSGKKRLTPLRQQWREFFTALNRVAGLQDA